MDPKNAKKRETERDLLVNKIVENADREILSFSDGSLEETNFLTAMVAKKMVEKSLIFYQQQMLRADLEK